MRRTLRQTFFWLFLFAALSVHAAEKITDLKPTVILISLDGFRWDYPEKANATNLIRFGREGVRAEWMWASFPTKTAPNHYSIVTGLFPGHHGVVSNTFWDDKEMRVARPMDDSDRSHHWESGEPIWLPLERAAQKTAPLFWPGAPAAIHGIRPTYARPYQREPDDETLGWFFDKLDRPVAERPTFLTLYWPYVDDAGHDFGPDSRENMEAVRRVDALLGRVFDGLRERGIYDQINIIIVSDHGMTPISDDRKIFLDELIDMTKVNVVDYSPVLSMRAKDPKDSDVIYKTLRKKLTHAKVYKKGQLPRRTHYNHGPRIMPLMIVADDGWEVTTRRRFERRKEDKDYPNINRGNHGYDNIVPNMRAIFFARGPAFQKGRNIAPIRNVDVYIVMCRILGIVPAKNDGNKKVPKRVLR